MGASGTASMIHDGCKGARKAFDATDTAIYPVTVRTVQPHHVNIGAVNRPSTLDQTLFSGNAVTNICQMNSPLTDRTHTGQQPHKELI